MKSIRLQIIGLIFLIALVALFVARVGHAIEIKEGMKWEPHQSGILVWHTPETVCLHDTAGNFEAPDWYKENYVDHGNYVAVLTKETDPSWVYWIGKEPSQCATNGHDSVPVVEKTWICDVDCRGK